MIFPRLRPSPQSRVVTETFLGLDRRAKLPDGAFAHMENLSPRHFPLLSPRLPRGSVRRLRAPGGLLEKDALCYVDEGTLYINHAPTALTGLSPGDKQLVSMGAYILVFPDKRYYNTEDPADFGDMEAELRIDGTVSYRLCNAAGEPIGEPVTGAEAPTDPANGTLWLDEGDGSARLRQWSESAGLWVELATVYTRIGFTTQGSVPAQFRELDGVELSGAHFESLNGQKILYALGGGTGEADYIVVVGLIPGRYDEENGAITLRRRLPDMDYVCQCQNRLWGCRYGHDGERVVNELYASALGDFRNFRQYLGLSTDSWTASLGSDGDFTGAVSYQGQPVFFKENRIHPVSVSPMGAHRVEELVCRGVEKGSARSLAVLGESLYYKSREELCVWQGGFPVSLSEAWGEERFHEAAAGVVDGRYYLSARDDSGAWHLLVYDPELGLWYREDGLHVRHFAAVDGELFAIDAESGELLALKGSVGESEGAVRWCAETGLLAYRSGSRKYLSRYALSLRMAAGSSVRLYLRYDSEGDWIDAGTVALAGAGTVVVPVRPRRCDHMALRLEGVGDVKLYAMSRILETGSDM